MGSPLGHSMSRIEGGNERPRSLVPEKVTTEPREPPRPPSTRTRLIAAFVVTVMGLLGVEGAVLLTVYPQLSALHSIADDHARALEDAARIRLRVERLHSAGGAADEVLASDARQVEQGARHVHDSLRWALVAASLVGLLGLGAAIGLLRHALAGLERERAHWRERSAEVEAFAARAAHELRSPLQTVMLALSVARTGRDPSAIERAMKGTQRLGRTIDDLLEFSRAAVTAGPGTAGIGDAIREVLDELGAQLGDGRVHVSVDAPPDLRAAIAPGLLRTILRNLVGNALKYGVSQGSTRVEVTATGVGARVQVQVLDEGPGIPPDQLPHVFEAFVRATTKPDGFGLGLATVKRVVEAHGGEVSIWSRPERGTRVSFQLPSPPVTPAPDHPATASQARSNLA